MKNVEALSLEDLEMVSGGVDDNTATVLELLGDIVDWFESWW